MDITTEEYEEFIPLLRRLQKNKFIHQTIELSIEKKVCLLRQKYNIEPWKNLNITLGKWENPNAA